LKLRHWRCYIFWQGIPALRASNCSVSDVRFAMYVEWVDWKWMKDRKSAKHRTKADELSRSAYCLSTVQHVWLISCELSCSFLCFCCRLKLHLLRFLFANNDSSSFICSHRLAAFSDLPFSGHFVESGTISVLHKTYIIFLSASHDEKEIPGSATLHAC